MNNLKKLSINLVTYNGERFLYSCLKSLKNQTFQDFDLKVLDNGSFDKTLEILNSECPETKVISYSKNIGFAKAHNQLIAWSKEPYILLLNQDIIMDENYLELIVSFLDEYPEAAGVSGKLCKWDVKNNVKTDIIDSLGLKIYKNHRVKDIGQGEKDNKNKEKAKAVFGLSGALPVFRRTALEAVKVLTNNGATKKWEYLDEDFFSYKEDIDLNYRLILNGQNTFYLPNAKAYHNRTTSLNSKEKKLKTERATRTKSINIYSYRNHLATILKNEFLINLFKYFFPIFWYEFKKFFYIVFFEPNTLKGLLLFLKDFKKNIKKRKYIISNIRKIKASDLAVWYKKNN